MKDRTIIFTYKDESVSVDIICEAIYSVINAGAAEETQAA